MKIMILHTREGETVYIHTEKIVGVVSSPRGADVYVSGVNPFLVSEKASAVVTAMTKESKP